jgi:transcription elongation GreA/GreB family factor
MNRTAAINALIEALRDELGLAIRASKDAGEYATHEEARAESKYDTQGLESSYLAAGQAAQAEAIAEAIQALEKLRKETPESGRPIGLGSLFECDWGDATDWFLLVPARGGTTAEVDKHEVTAITPESPIGTAALGKTVGARVSLLSGRGGMIRSVAV